MTTPERRSALLARVLLEDVIEGRVPWSPDIDRRLAAAAAIGGYRKWTDIARPDQLPPGGDWLVWLLLGGRGAGKTRAGAEWSHEQAKIAPRGALVGPTIADVRDVMIEGDSGLLATAPPGFRPEYVPARRRVTWPNGAIATTYSAEEPERLRGPQHGWAWCDELAAYLPTRIEAVWSNLLLGLRLGTDPRICATTTPRPTPFVIRLVKEKGTHLTRASTYDNLANLAPTFRAQVVAKYEGTRLGRQELLAELLEDIEGALWTHKMIETDRMPVEALDTVTMRRIVVAIDPAVTVGEDSDDTGIIVAGIDHRGHVYVLEDLTCHVSADRWLAVAVDAYKEYRADRIIAEVNNGGDLVQSLLRAQHGHGVSFKKVTATRGKKIRAEPVSALYEQHRVHHVGGFPKLEDELTTWTPLDKNSPDRMDALVWAVTELAVEPQRKRGGWSM